MLFRLAPETEFLCVHVAPLEGERRTFIEYQTFQRLAGANTQCHVIKGDVTDRLLGFAAEYETDFVLLGHRRAHSGRRSLARRLAMQAPCSVWMVPEGSAARLQKILIPIDFSKTAADCLHVGTALAELVGEEQALALHVYFNQANVTYDEYDEIIRNDRQEAFRIFASRINLHGVDVVPLFEEAENVAHAVNRVATETGSDLIVMGTRGRSRSAAVLLGSATEQTIIETTIPILAVKHFGARLRLLQALLNPGSRKSGSPRFS